MLAKYYLQLLWFINCNICPLSSSRATCKSEPQIQHPPHGLWSVLSGTSSPFVSQGSEVPPGTALNIQCQPGYKLQGISFIICTGKTWSSEIGKCLVTCPSITPTQTTIVTCTNPTNKEVIENCTDPEDGTIAKITCAKFYEISSPVRNLQCDRGSWNQPIPECRPVCGRKSVSAEPLIIGGVTAKTTDFPWQVVIYGKHFNSENFYFYCSGALINEQVVVTAAHCVELMEVGDLLVAAGKVYRKLNESRDANTKQVSIVKEKFMAEGYQGLQGKFAKDIAVLITAHAFILNKYVLPICIDWNLEYEDVFTSGKADGSISGWGYTFQDADQLPEQLQQLEVPFVSYDECWNSFDESFGEFFTNDKICAGYLNQNKSLCKGDSGGGLAFRNSDGKYYLVGIVSIGPNTRNGQCDSQQYFLYTKVSSYLTNLIFEKERKYRPHNIIVNVKAETVKVTEPVAVISKSNQLCGIKSVQTETLIIGGGNATRGEYPWQIAIYDTTKQLQLICGGSLIHQRIILTAAHCVTDQVTNQLNPKERYLLAAGKYFRNYEDPRDIHAQRSSIREMFVPPQYDGDQQNYMADIAIIITEKKFTFSKYIQPICIDWDNKYEDTLINTDEKGFVTGWGNTNESGTPSEVLKDLQVPYVDRYQCKTELPTDYDIYLTFDKICSGYLRRNLSVCKGDSGGGLVFKIPKLNRYYIAGIVSLSPRAPTAHGGCDSQQYSLYTRVSHYISSFILAKVRLFL